MSDWLIDTDGRLWSTGSMELRRRLWSRQPADELARYVVTNMGYAQLTAVQRSLCVRWRPTSLNNSTVVELVRLLLEQPEQRVVVSTLRERWSDAIHGTLADARNAILDEFDTAQCETGGYFEAEQRRPETLSERSALARVFRSVHDAQVRFDPISLWQMLERNSKGRFILTESQGERGPLRVVAWGRGYDSMPHNWITNAPGRDFEDQPDVNYARKGSRAYRMVAATGVPVVEDIDASAWWPGRGRMRLCYTRLLLPLIMQDGRQFVLSTAEAADAR